MSGHEQLLAALPGLRRYARVIVGSPQDADALICRAIDEMGPIARNGRTGQLAVYRDAAVALFQAFHDVLAQPDVTTQQPHRIGDSELDDRILTEICALPSAHRHILLLRTLSQFTTSEVATILYLPISFVHRSYMDARRRLTDHFGARILLIEDDPITAMDLRELLEGAGRTIIGTAASNEAALQLARRHWPDLVLVDVMLSGRDIGVAIANLVRQTCDSSIIFVTGHPDKVRASPRARSDIVISKPFEGHRLRACVERVLAARSTSLADDISCP